MTLEKIRAILHPETYTNAGLRSNNLPSADIFVKIILVNYLLQQLVSLSKMPCKHPENLHIKLAMPLLF